MNRMKDREAVKEQYSNSQNLDTRISIHEKYSVNKQGFGNWLSEQYHFFDGCRILELGCGNGDAWHDGTERIGANSQLILSDFSEGMVKEAQKRLPNCPNVSFRQIDIQNIPYADESFDFVIANMMLYHVPNLDKALTEVARVLKPDGLFYAATFGENGISRYLMNNLSEFGYHADINGSFTLQNGASALRSHFARVERRDYPDALEVTDTNDLLDYMFSMTSISDIKIDRKNLFDFFQTKKDSRGIIRIPKEYGLFVSGKQPKK